MSLFRHDCNENDVMLYMGERLRKERDKRKKAEERCAISEAAALKVLSLYGVEAVDRYVDLMGKNQ